MKTKNMGIAAVILIVMVMAVFASGCGSPAGQPQNTGTARQNGDISKTSTDTAEKPEPIISCRYVVPGSERPDTGIVTNEISKKMQADGTNVQLKLDYIPWDVWEQKTNAMFASGEEMDMIHTMDNYIPNTQALLAKNGIVPLNEYIDRYGQDLKNSISPEAWKQATFKDGKIYAVPAMWTELGNIEGFVNYRKDLFDKYGIKEPKTLDEMMNAAATLQADVQKDTGEKWYILPNGIAKCNLWLYRTFDTFPFVVKESEELVKLTMDGKAESWLESDDFKRQCQYFMEFKKRGLLNPNILSVTDDELSKYVDSGKYLFSLTRNFGNIKNTTPEAVLSNFQFNPEKGNFRQTAYVNCNTVPVTSKHPEAGIKFLNWLNKSADNTDLLLYGIKDRHWTALGDRTFQWADTNKDGQTYNFDNWMIANMKFMLFDQQNSPLSRQIEYTYNKDAKNFIGMGFNFDSSSVNVEYANCLAEMQNSIYPLKFGILDFDKNYPGAIKKMKAAGLDKVVAEYQRQYAGFLAGKGQ